MAECPADWAEIKAQYETYIETLQETAEMATVDKEIAEEKLDSCQKELNELRAKFVESTKKQENDDDNVEKPGAAVYQLQKVEEQNEILKQALVKLRDISARDKKALEEKEAELELLHDRCMELEELEQKHLEQINIFTEQIDCNSQAQDMIEQLSEQKTTLEEKSKELTEQLNEMEALNDLNEQILKSVRENEVELQGELDKLKCEFAELFKKKRDLEDYLNDQERSFAKLREENQALQNQISNTRERSEDPESVEMQKHEIENVAYKLNFSESKMAEKEAELVRYRRNLASMEEQMNSLSQLTKVQAQQIDEFKLNYESKVSEISELKRLLKKKIELISELEIRREMAEKKLQNMQQESEIKLNELNRKLEELQGREVEYEEALKRQEEDIDNMELERRELREQLSRSNINFDRSSATANMSMMTAQEHSFANTSIRSTIHETPSVKTAIFDPVKESVLENRVHDLMRSYEFMKSRNYELELKLAERDLNKECPIYMKSALSKPEDGPEFMEIKELSKRALKLKRETRLAMIKECLPINSRNIESQKKRVTFEESKLAFKYQGIENDAHALLSNSRLVSYIPAIPKFQSTPVK